MTARAAPVGQPSIQVTVAARAVQPGELAVLTITTGEPVDRVRVRAFDRAIPAFKDGGATWRALIGIDLAATPQTDEVTVDATAGTRSFHTTYELAVRPKHFATRRLTVDEAFVNPPASVAERIKAEAEELNRVWTSSAPERLWSGPFSRPVADPAVSRFGTRSIFNGKPLNPHTGADFLSPAGTPIKAPNAGHVVLARDLYFSGNTVIVDHGLGLFSMFAHLSAFAVREGDSVVVGQLLGRVGATGRVTGPHLHWAVRANGARVDPLSLIAVLGN